MSDDEFMMDGGDGDEDYDFEYEEDGEDETEASVENDYYKAKGERANVEEALKLFEAIVQSEEPKRGEFGFKALKQMTKLCFNHGQYDRALEYYKRVLAYTKTGAVTRNVAEASINKILDYVSADQALDTTKMQHFYETTMTALQEAKNERLSTKTNLKLAKLWLDRKEYSRLNKILRELHAACQVTDEVGEMDSTKGTLQLEVYALEIQMYGDMKNNKKLREIYDKTSRVRSAIPHPRIQGVIRECGGKMYMSERDWAKAQVDFFEAFKSYDEAGSPQRIQVLKYLVLAHMLMNSQIDLFDSQETKPYKNNEEISAMTRLVGAYQRRDVHEAEKILRDNRASIMDDPFIRDYITDVLRSLRTQWILDIIKPYTRVEIPYLSRQLSVPDAEVEDILIALILDDKVQGRIDQTTSQLILDRHKALETRRYRALDKWSETLGQISHNMLAKSATAGSLQPERGGPGGQGAMPAGGIPWSPGAGLSFASMAAEA